MARNPRSVGGAELVWREISGLLLYDWLRPSRSPGGGAGRRRRQRRAQSCSGWREETRGGSACRRRSLGARQRWTSRRQRSRASAASIWKFVTRWPRSARNSSWTSWRSKSAVCPFSPNFPAPPLPAFGARGAQCPGAGVECVAGCCSGTEASRALESGPSPTWGLTWPRLGPRTGWPGFQG